MLEFDYPWLFFALPLPLLWYWLSPARREQREAIQAPFFEELARLTGKTPETGAIIPRRNLPQKLLGPVTWLLIVTAAARPQWVEEPITRVQSARDLMLAVDLSGSMDAEDFTDPEGNPIDRVTAVKQVLDDFITRRDGDRIGLMFFGSQAFLQVPFTLDHKICLQLLREAEPRLAGPQTMIGDAIGLAVKLFKNAASENRVLILLTDGNDTASKVPPKRAASIAAETGVTIHTIAIGDPATVGEKALDVGAMKEISTVTGGQFFQALDREGLEEVYRRVDEVEPAELESLSYRPKRPLYQWPLGAAGLVTLLYHLFMSAASVFTRGKRIHA